MVAVIFAFADTEDEVSFRQNAMQAPVIDPGPAVPGFLQRRHQRRDAVRQARIVFGQSGINVVPQPVERAIDQHRLDEGAGERAVGVGTVEIFRLDRPVDHAAPRCVRSQTRLDIVPVFDCLAVLEAEDLEPDPARCEVVFGVPEHEVAVLEGADHVHPRRRFRQPLEQRGKAFAAFPGLRVVLDVFCFVDHGDRSGIAGLDAFQAAPLSGPCWKASRVCPVRYGGHSIPA